MTSAVTLFSRIRRFSGLCTLILLACGIVFSLTLVPGSQAAQAAPAAQSDVSAPSSTTAAQAKRQAQRREEVQQRKIDNPEVDDGVNIYRHSATV